MLEIRWKDKVTNACVLEKVKEGKSMYILNTIWQRKHRWLGHMLRNEVLLREIIEGGMKGKAFWGRKRLHMLSGLASSVKYLEVKKAAVD